MPVANEMRELMARTLGLAADSTGAAVAVIEMLARLEIETIRKVPAESDVVVIQGPDICKALRTIQARLNRGY